MQEITLQTTRTARYFQLGRPSEKTEQIWFVLHGYGHLASYFIKHFEKLDDGRALIVAPEGLSRFYLSGFAGRIGASWMTSENRLDEISDYLDYLNRIFESVTATIGQKEIDITVLGFSQGTATAARWAAQKKIKLARLILWAGLVPPELVSEEGLARLSDIPFILVAGKNDQFANAESLAKQKDILQKKFSSFRLITFDGGHELDAKILDDLYARTNLPKSDSNAYT